MRNAIPILLAILLMAVSAQAAGILLEPVAIDPNAAVEDHGPVNLTVEGPADWVFYRGDLTPWDEKLNGAAISGLSASHDHNGGDWYDKDFSWTDGTRKSTHGPEKGATVVGEPNKSLSFTVDVEEGENLLKVYLFGRDAEMTLEATLDGEDSDSITWNTTTNGGGDDNTLYVPITVSAGTGGGTLNVTLTGGPDQGEWNGYWAGYRAVALVPEPATMLILAMGGGLALIRRRRQK